MDSFFEYRNCPNCGQDCYTVLFDSNMGKSDFHQGIESVYMLPGDKYGRHVKCQRCHLVYVNPIKKENEINKDYSQMKSIDATIVRESRLRATKLQVQLINKYSNSTSLLDIGCGEGFFLSNAANAGYRTKGIELSQDAAAYAKREFGLDIEAGAFEDVQFPGNYFDVVTLWQVLEHIPHPLEILKEAHRILKPGGLIAASTPDIEGIPSMMLRRKWWNIRRIHINQFSTKTLMDILQNAGFKNVSSVSYRESISLLMLLIPIVRHLKAYGLLKDLSYPSAILGKALNKITLTYPSRLDNCTVIGFKG
ncbi:MAG TPA: class I SAM-dependent methyltransferase [Dehalococcoidia bacterium]|nr:class I SAM-dependent methyltransferase [Dehalococcoidia bacterium]